jgi:hypothetical protein
MKCISVLAIGALLSLAPCIQSAMGHTFILQDGNSMVTINADDSSGMNSWTVGQNQLDQYWNWRQTGEFQ